MLIRDLSVKVVHDLASPGYSIELQFPDRDIPSKALKEIPMIGKFGAEFAVRGGLEYEIPSGDWEVFAGFTPYGRWAGRRGRRPYSPPRFYVGNREIDFKVGGFASGTATQSEGIKLQKLGIDLGIDESKFEILTIYLTDYVPGLQWGRALDWFAKVGADINSIQRVRVYGRLAFDSKFSLLVDPVPVRYDGMTLTPGLGLEIAYEPHLKVAKGRVYAGGSVEATLDWPSGQGIAVKEVKAGLSGGLVFRALGFEILNEEFVLLNWQWSTSPVGLAHYATTVIDGERWLVVPVASSGLKPMPRPHLEAGPERFTATEPRVETAASEASGALDAFRQLGRIPARGSVGTARGAGGSAAGLMGIEQTETNQVDLTLVQNVFPNSSPALAARTNELLLLYVADNGSSNALQFTDIRWTLWNGHSWSAPASIQMNSQAEFSPQVAFDGNGDAIAVWERVSDPGFNTVDLTAMAAELEIVWSRWDRSKAKWTEPTALTSNGHLDYAPLLCGPMANGNVLLLWTKNEENRFMGASANGADTVLCCEWSAATGSWGAPQVLLTNVMYRLSQSLGGVGDRAVYAWTVDADGVITNDVDQEVFVVEYADGHWAAPQQFTSNSVPDKNVRVAVQARSSAGPAGVQEGFESGDFSRSAWVHGGDGSWSVQTAQKHSGSFAAASGMISHDQSSRLTLTTACVAGQVRFAYRVSSESGFDFLRFFIDGQEQQKWSGAVEWATASFPVSAGQHTFEWQYTKDGSESEGSDKAWIDDVVIPGLGGQSVFMVWQQGNDLVMSRDFDQPTIVRPDSATAGFADFAVTVGSLGHVILLWQEMSPDGSDAHYAVYDPASNSWSKDDRLCRDGSLEQSFAPVWDALGNLVVAYNKVETLRTNKTVRLDDGSSITITNVPMSGRVDLTVTRRALVTDLELAAGDFRVQGANYLPGDPLALTAMIRNSGNVALTNVAVAFYDGDPKAGGTLITNVTVPGWLEGGGSAQVEVVWLVPEPASPHTLYAVVESGRSVTEYNEGNNTQSIGIGGTDLTVFLKSAQAETDGSVRVIAVVQNLGAPTAPASVVAVRLEGQTNAPLAVASVPELEPGRLAEVALDLPAGTQPEGERLYRLFADETRTTADVDLRNNTVAFAVNLWVDTDEDAMPDGWEQTHGLAIDNPADASEDPDQDGLSNLAEYLAGTDPRDGRSYLWISSIGLAEQPAGIELRWGSVPNRLYTVLRSESVPADFVPIVEHVLSTPPENVWIDSSATNSATYFYRLKVE